MPELPEVEVVRRGLERYVTGRTIESVEVLNPRSVRRHLAGPADFAAALCGRTVTAVRRRGKYLWLPLAAAGASLAGGAGGLADGGSLAGGAGGLADGGRPAGGAGSLAGGAGSPLAAGSLAGGGGTAGAEDLADDALLAHLGMSGQLLIGTASRPLASHDRVVFRFTDGGPDLRMRDQRTFGHLTLVPGGAVLPALISHIAPDPLEQAFDAAVLAARLRQRRTGIKTALLDQSLVSGVGNIYADEALWRARLHWARPASVLRPGQVQTLLAAVREVLMEALAAGGTSFDSLYVNVNGESGYFSRSLAVYGRAGQPCLRCGAPIRREHFMNRSAYSCPRCQPRPRALMQAR